MPNVVATPIPGGQWLQAKAVASSRSSSSFCEHTDYPAVPIQAKLIPTADAWRTLPGGTEPMLVAAGVRKQFGALRALDGVDFTIGPGEAVGIVGPNGAGKTTLLNVLAGTVAPSSGTVSFKGATSPGAGRGAARLGIGRAHQIPRPFGGMTVFENCFVGATTGGGLRRRAAYARCLEVLELSGLTDVANRRAETLGLLGASGSSWRARSRPIQRCSCWMRSVPG